jgi:diadenosine tetraphosphatase ApaH/serine/threonine PP2A family protein phosphatase
MSLDRYERIAVIGGVYSNTIALESALVDARRRGVDAIFCLGDLGAFGPHPDKVFPLLIDGGVRVMQGNYDNSIGNGLADCQCGYTDPRDNFFAKISYDYTFANTSDRWKEWMRGLPESIRIELGRYRVLMSHGSPRRMNEFFWESTTPTHFLGRMLERHRADVVLATHTGIHWKREIPEDRHFVNVGVIGRPANDGRTHVWYTLLDARDGLKVEFVPVAYDYRSLAEEMKSEKLPQEFIDTILTGWWTTCLEILPLKERKRGMY